MEDNVAEKKISGPDINPDDFGKHRVYQGVKTFISELKDQFPTERVDEISVIADEVISTDTPTISAIEKALLLGSSNEQFLLLSLVSDKAVRRAGVGQDEESVDKFAGFYLDSLVELLNREVQKNVDG